LHGNSEVVDTAGFSAFIRLG